MYSHSHSLSGFETLHRHAWVASVLNTAMLIKEVLEAPFEVPTASWHHVATIMHIALYTVRVKCCYELLSPLQGNELVFTTTYEQCWNTDGSLCHHVSVLRVFWQKGPSLLKELIQFETCHSSTREELKSHEIWMQSAVVQDDSPK